MSNQENQTNPNEVSKYFGLRQKGNETEVIMTERASGNIGIQLSTIRDGMEPLVTSMILTPKTFSLLCDAMLQAAHNIDIWQIAPKIKATNEA